MTPERAQEFPAALQGHDIPAVLLPYQRAVLQSTAAHPVTVVEKSRRIGVTWGIAADAVLTSAADRTAGGMDTFYIGYEKEMTREFIDTAAMWAKAFAMIGGEVEEFVFRDQLGDDTREIQAFRIRFASGFDIVALCSRPRSLRGRQGYVIVDEAAFHDALEELLKAAFALLIWGGKVLVISTHDGADNPFAQLVEDCRSKRKPYGLIRITFDEALADGLYRRICLIKGDAWTAEAEAAWRQSIYGIYGDAAEEELDVVPRAGGGVFLARSLIEARMVEGVPVIRWQPPAGFVDWEPHLREAEVADWCERTLLPLLIEMPRLQSFCGVDFGRHRDLSVIWPVQVDRDLVRRTPFVIELRDVPFTSQSQILFYALDRLPLFMAGAMDAGGNGAYLGEVARQRYGAERIAEIKLSQEWYREIMPQYRQAFQDGGIVLPKDADVLADHTLIKQERGVAKVPDNARTRGADGGDRHGDTAVAGALAYHASLMDVAPIEFTAAGNRRAGADLADYRGAAW